MIGRLESRIKYSSIQNISQEVLQFLVSVKKELHQIGNSLNEHYFAYT
jgi:uncharacterized alpha-E superfamily protein